MADTSRLGNRVRVLRKSEGLTQAQLAQRLGVSPSYLNLIENNRRPLTAKLLLRLAQEFALDLASFSGGVDARLLSDVREALSDPLFSETPVTADETQEFASASPSAARAMLQLYQHYRAARQSAATFAHLAQQGEEGARLVVGNPTEEVNDLLQRHENYFHEVELAAEELWRRAKLEPGNIFGGLRRYLKQEHDIEVQVIEADGSQVMRRYDPERRTITLSEVLPPRTRRFQLAHQVGLIGNGDTFDDLGLAAELKSQGGRALTRVVLANYFAAALLMPYEQFHAAAFDSRYDIELLAHRYRTSFEQVCHRLTTLRRPKLLGIPLHFIRIDIAGNISKRYSGSGIRMPRFSGACPRWNVHAAFMTPGMIRHQLSRMSDNQVYFCIARTVRRDSGSYNRARTVHAIGLGCEVQHARKMVYADGIDLDAGAATPVGVTCRTCDQQNCEQRVFPAMQNKFGVDENVRGLSFYSPIPKS